MKIDTGLFERLSDTTISYEDAETWAQLILPIRSHMNGQPIGKKAFLYDRIFDAMKNRLQMALEGKDPEEAEDDYVLFKLSQIDDDPYEKTRWRLVAGFLECRDSKALKNFGRRIQATPEEADLIRQRLEDIALYEKIEPPLPRYLGAPAREEAIRAETVKTPELDDQKKTGEISALFDFKALAKKLFQDPPKLKYEEAVVWSQAMFSIDSDEEERKAVEYAVRNFTRSSWKGNDETEEGRRVFKQRVDMIVSDPVQTLRHLLITAADLCEDDPDKRIEFMRKTGLDEKTANDALHQLHRLATDHRVLAQGRNDFRLNAEQVSETPNMYIDKNNQVIGLRFPDF